MLKQIKWSQNLKDSSVTVFNIHTRLCITDLN